MIRRRRRASLGIITAGAVAALLVTSIASGRAGPPARSYRDPVAGNPLTGSPASVANAYTFLDRMMDTYAAGSTLRLVQSYTGGYLQQQGLTDSFTYDDALIIDALLARGTAGDLSRARVIGSALLFIQAHDPSHDGRIRAAYAPAPLTDPSKIQVTDTSTDVGNMAWAGQALVQLYARTGNRSYLAGAKKIAAWVQHHAYDTRGAGGYTGGANGHKIEWKSTEHNIDVYAFFRLLASESGAHAWSRRAAHARSFVAAMWDAKGKKFWVGTDGSGVKVNKSFLPEDVNTWTYLALRDPKYAASITWDIRKLAATDGSFHGLSFASCDRSKVWFEGTAHAVAALAARNAAGDATTAQQYLDSIQLAQSTAPNHDGYGIVAASGDGLKDCDGGRYYASLHTGATSWYLLAAGGVDPFRLLPARTFVS